MVGRAAIVVAALALLLVLTTPSRVAADGDQVVAAGFGGQLPASGVALALWDGGSVGKVATTDPGVGSIWVAVGGSLVGYVVGALDLANAPFLSLYPGGEVSAGTPMVVVVVDDAPAAGPPPPVPGANRPPVIASLLDYSVERPETVSFTPIATDPDGDAIVRWEYVGELLSDGRLQFDPATGAFSWISNGPNRTIRATLRAYDSEGEVGGASFLITVTGPPGVDPARLLTYSQFDSVQGVAIRAPAGVSAEAIRAVKSALDLYTSTIDSHVLLRLVNNDAAIEIIPEGSWVTSLPGRLDLSGKAGSYGPFDGFGQRAFAAGPWSTVGEEGTLRVVNNYPVNYATFHEFAHTVRNIGLSQVQQSLLTNLYSTAATNGAFADSYMMSSQGEYFATLSEAWLGKSYIVPGQAAEILSRDPAAYAFLEEIYGPPR